MFYAHFVLAKKGPLARIWLAAHWDKKLTKAHVYETNIESSVDGILQPKVKMALRTSGHLLLGVVRIYSRKAKYLLADCNEAFVKIKMAFRPGMVDLPEDKREAAMNAITLPDVFHDFDTAMPDLDDVDIDSQFTLNQTRAEEITMREDYGNITLNDGDDGFGDSHLDIEPEMLRDGSVARHDNFGSIRGNDVEFESEKERDASGPHKDPTVLDAPIHDDGFGGAGVQDFLSAGLFDGGSLFDDPVPSGSTDRTGGVVEQEEDDFPGAPSPIQSDGSRPATPSDNMSLGGDDNNTPLQPPETLAESQGEKIKTQNRFGDKDTTTLLHNEDESFALAPIEASALKGARRQRKRKLVVDEIKAITGDGMKAQLSDSSDIVTTLDIAPPTKRLMLWKETGGVEELFNLPGRKLFSRHLLVDYQDNLKITVVADEHFDTLPGGHSNDDLHLEKVGGAYDNEENPSPQKKGRKRKQTESPEKSVYMKRQEELARKQEEFVMQQQKQREETLRAGDPSGLDGWGNVSYNSAYNPQTLGQQSFSVSGLASPAYSGYAQSMGYPNPSHEPSYQSSQTPVLEPNFSTTLPPGQNQSNFTEQWVNQVQNHPNVMSSPPPQTAQTYNSPSEQSYQPQDDWDNDNYEADNLGTDDYDDDDNEDFYDNEQSNTDEDMQEDETIEDFENRVLNKRAALLHKQLNKKFANTFNQLTQKCNRKQVAQKFHSILVLQKMMALDINQDMDPPYADISIRRGSAWETAGNGL